MDVLSSELVNDEKEDDSSWDDEYHDAMENDKLDISNNNENDNFLKLLDLLSNEESNRDDVEKDAADFLLT